MITRRAGKFLRRIVGAASSSRSGLAGANITSISNSHAMMETGSESSAYYSLFDYGPNREEVLAAIRRVWENSGAQKTT